MMAQLWARKVDVALIALALALSIWVVIDRGSVTTAEAEDRRYQLIDAWRPADIATLDVQVADHEMALRKLPDGTWSLEEDGRQVEADEQVVGQLLVTLEFAGYDRTVEGLDAATTGFDAPRMRFSIGMGALSYTIIIGKAAANPEGAAYAQVSGGRRGTAAYVVRAELLAELSLEPGALRTRHLPPYLSTELKRFELPGGVSIERGAWGGRTAGTFLVKDAAGRALRADRRALDGWLSVLGRLDLEKLVPLPEKDPDAFTLSFTPRDDARPSARIALGGPCPGGDDDQILAVRRDVDPIAGCVPKDTIAALAIAPGRLTDLHVIGTADGDITELRLESEGVVVEIARKDTGWHMRKPTEGAAEPEPTSELLSQLIAASGKLYQGERDLAAIGLDPPRGTLRIIGLPERAVEGSKERVETVSVGEPVGDKVFVRRHDDDAILELTVDDARALEPRPSALRKLDVFAFSADEVRELRLDCGKRQRMTRSIAGAWTLEEPEVALAADLGSSNEFIEGLRQLRAVRWVSERAEKGQGLDPPWCTIAVDRVHRDGDSERVETTRLRLGAETRAGYFAQADDARAVFVVPKVVASLARSWFLDRTALTTVVADIERVTLKARDGAERSVEKGALGTVVERTLAELLAESVVDLGPARAEDEMDDPLLRIEVTLRGQEPFSLKVGRGDSLDGTSVFFVRKSGIDATFAVAQARLRPLIDSL
jgi:hypothetical protein